MAVPSLAQQVTTSSYSGPVPPPVMLQGYEAVAPGSANRILEMAENQAKHRMKLESSAMWHENARSYFGLAAGLLVSFGFIGLAGFVAYLGHPRAAAGIAALDLGGLAGVFVYGTKSRREERLDRAALMVGKKR